MCFRNETLWDRGLCISVSSRPLSAAAAFWFIFYHILQIWQPPAEFSARLSAVNAETGMRRYNNRGAVIIPYPSDMAASGGI